MISLSEIQNHFPLKLQNPSFYPYTLKEYFQYRMLDIIFSHKLGRKLSFIGGTSLRILYGIDRFSEDLDFDSFNLTREEFIVLTDFVISRLQDEGIIVTAEDKTKDLTLHAFRRNLIFPELLYNLKMTGHKEQKFLIKIESQAHFFAYTPDTPIIQKFNIFTQINAAPVDILLSMKIGAMLERQKGRDFYDCIFLMGKTLPNWNYLSEKFGINSPGELEDRILESCKTVDFSLKARDFNKLTFDQNESQKILLFPEYIKQKKFSNIV